MLIDAGSLMGIKLCLLVYALDYIARERASRKSSNNRYLLRTITIRNAQVVVPLLFDGLMDRQDTP
jgi:hypothetical protein